MIAFVPTSLKSTVIFCLSFVLVARAAFDSCADAAWHKHAATRPTSAIREIRNIHASTMIENLDFVLTLLQTSYQPPPQRTVTSLVVDRTRKVPSHRR